MSNQLPRDRPAVGEAAFIASLSSNHDEYEGTVEFKVLALFLGEDGARKLRCVKYDISDCAPSVADGP